MEANLVECNPEKCSGQPSLVGRRLTICDVVLGLLRYSPSSPEIYLETFELSKRQAVAAIDYCRTEQCEVDQPRVSCWGCSKRFSDNEETFDEFLEGIGGEPVKLVDGMYSIGSSLFAGELDDLFNDWLGEDCWKLVESLQQLRDQWENEVQSQQVKVYLDDERPVPDGWQGARWPEDAIGLLESGNVTHISLDHDLADDDRGTGYDVILWIEKAVATRGFKPPEITVHSANTSAREKMELGIQSIQRLASQNESNSP